jgi:hypothetical protein
VKALNLAVEAIHDLENFQPKICPLEIMTLVWDLKYV